MAKHESKHRSEKPTGVEIQKGPISMVDQFNSKHMRGEKCIREDLEHNAMWRSSQTLTVHEPKR